MSYNDSSIRDVRVSDAASLQEIYAPYVLENAISFETDLPSRVEFERRIAEVSARFPWLVFEADGRVVAYAYAGVFKARAAYDWTVESTVYVHRDFHGRGIGERIYSKLLEVLRGRGIVNVIAIIALPNEASVLFHERLGFKNAGRLPSVGLKFGKWWDIGYWQLKL